VLGSDDNRRGFQSGSRPQLTHVEGTDFQKSRAFLPAGVTQAGKIVWLPGQTAVTELADCCPPCLLESFLRLSLVSCPISLFPATSISSVRKTAIVLSTSKSMPRAVTRKPQKTSSRATKSMTFNLISIVGLHNRNRFQLFRIRPWRQSHGCPTTERGGGRQTHKSGSSPSSPVEKSVSFSRAAFELNKSGPPAYRDQNTGQPSPDQSKVPGQPGNKSGPAVQPPKGTK